MKNFETKDTALGFRSVLDVDGTSRRVKVVISRMDDLDLDNDVIDKSAYNKTIKERGPKGANLTWHLTDHIPLRTSAIALFSELFVDGTELVGVTDIPKTTWGNDMMEFYNTGNVNQHSIGFRTIKSEPVNAGKPNEHRLIKEVLLYEGSAVLWGANPKTGTRSVGKSLTLEQKANKYFETVKELNNLAKLFDKGKLTDGSFELVEIRLAQLADTVKQLEEDATQPDDKSVEPGKSKMLLDVIKTFNNSFNPISHEKDLSTV